METLCPPRQHPGRRRLFPGPVCACSSGSPYLLLIFSGGQANLIQTQKMGSRL